MTTAIPSLSMTAAQHEALRRHLFPGDGKEAVAFVLCGRRAGDDRHRLVAHELLFVPYERCSIRTPDLVTWPTDVLDGFLAAATKKGYAIVKVHSHPSGYPRFSPTDDKSDAELFTSVFAWVDRNELHASVVMLPDGSMFGRAIVESGKFIPLERIAVVGDDIKAYFAEPGEENVALHSVRTAQAFGRGTYATLRRLRVGVVGASGTGGYMIDTLAKNAVGELVIVDPERVEHKNRNRIANCKETDVGRFKVDVAKDAVEAMGMGTRVMTYAVDLCEPEAIRALASCDIIAGCVDSIIGRHVANRIASYYVQPYFDVGVKLAVDKDGTITRVEAGANYVKPGGASLMSRGLYTSEQLRAAFLKRDDPDEYARRRKERYIEGIDEDQPAVSSLNMLAVSLGMNDLLARIHGYRDAPNAQFERQLLSLYLGHYEAEPLAEPCPAFAPLVGRGDEMPLLGMPALEPLR